jgi:hypothetical protein
MPLPSDLVRSRTTVTPSSSHEALKSSCACAVLSSVSHHMACTPSTTFERLQAEDVTVSPGQYHSTVMAIDPQCVLYLRSSYVWDVPLLTGLGLIISPLRV